MPKIASGLPLSTVAASIAVAVKSLYDETGMLKDGLTQRLAGDRASVNAYTTDHDDVVDQGNALARLCHPSGPPGRCRLRQDHNPKHAFCRISNSQCKQHWHFPLPDTTTHLLYF